MLYRPGDKRPDKLSSEAAHWVKRKPTQGSAAALFAAAVSTDKRYLAVAGGDRKVHVFDATNGQHVQAYPGHR